MAVGSQQHCRLVAAVSQGRIARRPRTRSRAGDALAGSSSATTPSCSTAASSAFCKLSRHSAFPVASTLRSSRRKSFRARQATLGRAIASMPRGLTALPKITTVLALRSTRSRRSSHSIQNNGLCIGDFYGCGGLLKRGGIYYFQQRTTRLAGGSLPLDSPQRLTRLNYLFIHTGLPCIPRIMTAISWGRPMAACGGARDELTALSRHQPAPGSCAAHASHTSLVLSGTAALVAGAMPHGRRKYAFQCTCKPTWKPAVR